MAEVPRSHTSSWPTLLRTLMTVLALLLTRGFRSARREKAYTRRQNSCDNQRFRAGERLFGCKLLRDHHTLYLMKINLQLTFTSVHRLLQELRDVSTARVLTSSESERVWYVGGRQGLGESRLVATRPYTETTTSELHHLPTCRNLSGCRHTYVLKVSLALASLFYIDKADCAV